MTAYAPTKPPQEVGFERTRSNYRYVRLQTVRLVILYALEEPEFIADLRKC